MTEMSALDNQFNNDMQWILNNEGEANLCSTRFRQMIAAFGGLGTAHRLLKPDRVLPANTFGYLRQIGRLDLAMESYAVMDKYRTLFSDEERVIAQWRMEKGD
jgi:hypothetical protein